MAKLISALELRRRIDEVQELGTLPHVMLQIVEATNDETAGARELGETIAKDQSLTAKLLKVANSAFYGQYGDVADVSAAVVLVGFDEIKRLALAISVIGMFEQGSKRSARRLRFWTHCLHTAVLSELIDREHGRASAGAFSAGLLHDLGRLVLDQYFPDIFRQLLQNEEATGRLPVDVEHDLLGTTHGRIGFWVAERWRLPTAMAEAIRFHHRPSSAVGAARLTAVIHIADALVHRGAADRGDPDLPRVIHPAALAQLDIVPSALDRYEPALAQAQEIGDALVKAMLRTAG